VASKPARRKRSPKAATDGSAPKATRKKRVAKA
jgi:hypothetical protein